MEDGEFHFVEFYFVGDLFGGDREFARRESVEGGDVQCSLEEVFLGCDECIGCVSADSGDNCVDFVLL